MKTTVVPITELTPEVHTELYSVLSDCFDGVCTEQFDRDLREKDDAVLLRNDAGALVGFSTFMMYRSKHIEDVTVVCSGDTVVLPEAWGSFALHQTWINTVRSRHSDPGRILWLLITSGFRTYRFLPVFFRNFAPACDQVESAEMADWRLQLARERWGPQFDAESGIVQFARPQRLAAELAGVPEGRRRDPHVEHFLRLNPGHAAGDELVCLTDLSDDNLTPAGYRMLYGRRPQRTSNQECPAP